MRQMKITPIKDEFKKLNKFSIKKEDFDKGPLPCLIRTHSGNKPIYNGVDIITQIGDIFSARASYEGLKSLDNDADVISIQIS